MRIQPRVLSLFLILTLGAPALIAAEGFVHPGVTHSKESIAFVRAKLAGGEEPWTAAWTRLRESRYADLDWQPDPHALVERGPSNDPDRGSSEFTDDGRAAYYHAVCWTLTHDKRHALKVAEILDAWSAKLEKVGHHDARLLIGMSGYNYVVAAELLRHTSTHWTAEGQARFETMLREVWYPVIVDFYPSANGNWDAAMLQVMLGMGVFLEDRAMFDRAKDYFLSGKGNGAIGNYFMASGQCQETGRDQAHTQMGLHFLVNTCEIAWIQGIDLYGALDNRLLAGFEYTSKYNLGYDVPYVPYKSFEGRYHYKKISDDSRGRFQSFYERAYNHYHNRRGLDAPYTGKVAAKLREGLTDPERDRERDRRRRRSRSAPMDTLMFYGQPAAFAETTLRVACFGDSITKRGYGDILGQRLSAEIIHAGVAGHSSAKGLKRMQNDVLALKPDWAVILFGTNDLRADADHAYVPIPAYQQNLEAMVAACRAKDIQPILCTLPPIDEEGFWTRHEPDAFDKLGGLAKMIEQYAETARNVAAAKNVPLVDLNRLLADDPTWMDKDGVHPSRAGNKAIAKHIGAVLAAQLEKE